MPTKQSAGIATEGNPNQVDAEAVVTVIAGQQPDSAPIGGAVVTLTPRQVETSDAACTVTFRLYRCATAPADGLPDLADLGSSVDLVQVAFPAAGVQPCPVVMLRDAGPGASQFYAVTAEASIGTVALDGAGAGTVNRIT